MKTILTVIIALLCVISIPFIYIHFTPKNTGIVVLPGLEVTEPVATSTATSTIYINEEYGFSLNLPTSWDGFTATSTPVDKGVIVTLRNPLWKKDYPRMDIPLLVYPIAQWTKWEETDFEGYKTAAPIGPTERGRNSKYVFATAARYNFSFLPGFEEVEGIIKTLKGL